MTPSELLALVQTIASIGAVLLSPPAIILFFLNRKNANKKLDLDEGALDVSVFSEQRAAFKELLDEARAATRAAEDTSAAALHELAQYKKDREKMNDRIRDQEKQIRGLTNKLKSLRALFQRILLSYSITLTDEEIAEFDKTAPFPTGPIPEVRFGDN